MIWVSFAASHLFIFGAWMFLVPDVRLTSKAPYQLEVMSAILIAMAPSDGLGVFIFYSVLLSSHV
jgi:hypothetical protein